MNIFFTCSLFHLLLFPWFLFQFFFFSFRNLMGKLNKFICKHFVQSNRKVLRWYCWFFRTQNVNRVFSAQHQNHNWFQLQWNYNQKWCTRFRLAVRSALKLDRLYTACYTVQGTCVFTLIHAMPCFGFAVYRWIDKYAYSL